VRDIETISATCTLTLPHNTEWYNSKTVPVERGDRIEVELGYDNELEKVFTGYIKTVSAKTPIEIGCDDEIYLLKNTPAKKKSYAVADVETLLREQLPGGVKFEVFKKQAFGKYSVNSDTVAQLLGDLQENGLTFYFRDGVLYAGMMFDHPANARKQVFKDGEGGNIIDDSDLVWNNADSISLRIKASGTDSAGKKISVEVGDPDGEVRSYFKYNTTKAALEAEAKKKLTEWKIAGLSGSFTTFGAKPVWLLDNIKIQTGGHPAGTYRVTKNTLTFGTGGYRQEITIGGLEK
jgi:hypothetical protein